jgi:hypothetical protein
MAELRRITLVLHSPDFAQPAEIVATVDSIPRTSEQLVMDGRTYRIKMVLHNYDDGTISVYANEDTS